VTDADATPTEGLERKLATILSADVAGYSRLMAEDEELTLRTFRGHKEVFEKLVEMHRGRVFNTAGDAILAEFGSAVEAVRCATEIQAALRTRNDQLLEDRQVRFRIGVNLGDVMVQGEDLLGDGVNVAARLQGAAEPGGICIAGSVYDQIRNKLSLSFKPLGDVHYKNIPQAVRTFAIAEVEGLGALPASANRENRSRRGFPIWPAIAAVFMLTTVGIGLWVYSDYRRGQTELSRQAHLAAAKATQARQRADADTRALVADRNKAEVVPMVVADPPAPAMAMAVMPDPARPPPAAMTAPEKADLSGLYRGQICYGPGEADPARCYDAQATVLNNRISGEWPGRIPGATIYLSGHISPAGDVEIHMHSKRADGSRFAIIDMIGTLRDGRIDAAGGFLNGRHVTLNWRKD
jgi:class 3 adenylate cyclase